jgi:hypothetical protein
MAELDWPRDEIVRQGKDKAVGWGLLGAEAALTAIVASLAGLHGWYLALALGMLSMIPISVWVLLRAYRAPRLVDMYRSYKSATVCHLKVVEGTHDIARVLGHLCPACGHGVRYDGGGPSNPIKWSCSARCGWKSDDDQGHGGTEYAEMTIRSEYDRMAKVGHRWWVEGWRWPRAET